VPEHRDLFPEPTRERSGPLGNSEPYVNGYRESTRTEAVIARRNINDWYRSFPDRDEKLARKLRLGSNDEHIPALDELFTHHVLSQRPGQIITYEEGGRGPDFRIYRQDQLVGSVEVLSLFQNQEWAKAQERHDRLADELDKRLDRCHGYWVTFEIFGDGSNVPPARFAAEVDQLLKQLPSVRDGSAARVPQKQWAKPIILEIGGARLHVRFQPVSPDRVPEPGETDRIVAGSFIGGFAADSARLRDRIAGKAGNKYDLRDAPYLVVVVVHSAMCDHEDFITGLYGSSAVYIDSGEVTRKGDGLFGWDQRRKAWKSTRLSAVCAMAAPDTFTPEETRWTLYHNPGPRYRWPSDLLGGSWEFRVSRENDQGVQMDWLTS
jgi:hypothetical protein